MQNIIGVISYLGLIRPENQIKNLILFIPIFFSGDLDFQSQNFFDVVKLFILFIACTSSVYLLNDYFDYENDTVNPRKINRTLSRKRISRKSLLQISIGVIFFYSILFYFINLDQFSKSLSFVYLVLFISYSAFLKHIPFLEMLIIPLGYLLRLYSADYLDPSESNIFIYLVMFCAVFFTILLKRYSELQFSLDYRSVLKHYNTDVLKWLIYINFLVAIIGHSIYTLAPLIFSKYGYWGILSNIIVFVFLTRCLIACLVNKNFEDPMKYFVSDKISMSLTVVYFGLFVINIY